MIVTSHDGSGHGRPLSWIFRFPPEAADLESLRRLPSGLRHERQETRCKY
jgi:hypothetical protein